MVFQGIWEKWSKATFEGWYTYAYENGWTEYGGKIYADEWFDLLLICGEFEKEWKMEELRDSVQKDIDDKMPIPEIFKKYCPSINF